TSLAQAARAARRAQVPSQARSHGVEKLAKLGKLVILQEGGYNQNNPVLANVIVNALGGKTLVVTEDFDPLSSAVTGTLKTRKVVEEKVKELKSALKEYFNL
ncbi:MAG: hypothetical protein QXH13_05660, partial [Thermoplasmata archaeon]